MVTCEKIAGVGSKCKGLDCPTTPCTGLSCKSLTKVNQTCQGVTSTGVKCLNGTGIIVPDGLDILIDVFSSHGISLEKHMVENSCGNSVPVYDVTTMHGLNQILGHVKFNNREFGDVLYRGQAALYDSLTPSLFRAWNGCAGTLSRVDTLAQIITRMMESEKIKGDLKLGYHKKANRYKVEGLLQHYGVPTKCIDLVDNHWVALWMGLYECQKQVKVDTYYHYQKREIPLIEILNKEKSLEESIYQYILLLALPSGKYATDGLTASSDFITVDLRKAVSSIFLRPHAQHAIVAERKVASPSSIADYDMAPAVVGILRFRIDIVDKWLGNGMLVTQENLFPPPSMDKGYDQLLRCQDLLVDGYELTKYI